MKKAVGLRIDVDSIGGFTKGVIPLIQLLNRFQSRATFFIITGRDNPLRGVPRIFREEGFLRRVVKLRRSIWQGMVEKGGTTLRESIWAIKESDHELALHGFHHFQWQLSLETWGIRRIKAEIARGRESFRLLTGEYPRAFAAPGWETTALFFHAEEDFGFSYASDTRGHYPFYPLIDGKRQETLQIPVTLPTLDELIALDDVERIVTMPLKSGDVYCAHAEFDGMQHLALFEGFLKHCLDRGFSVVPLEEVAKHAEDAPQSSLEYRVVPGRSRKVTCQKTPLKTAEMQNE